PAAEFAAKNPVAIVLSGGPSSVNDEAAPPFDTAVFDLGVPTMGICYGFQLMSTSLGGRVAKTDKREYGSTPVTVADQGALLAETPDAYKVWMSHGDSVAEAPADFTVLASTPDTPVAAFEHP
ncbi:GMP synthase (glutamine-hydrolyzing), partial [Burkholderia multivorans]